MSIEIKDTIVCPLCKASIENKQVLYTWYWVNVYECPCGYDRFQLEERKKNESI
jgi:hypothetical protein